MQNKQQNRHTATGRLTLPPGHLKVLGGVWLGKLLLGATRIIGRGGTTLPGRAAMKISPELPSYLGRQLSEGSILITGTNGKTTTAYLLKGILKHAGYRCVHNQSGSNMSWGVASSLIGAGSWSARLSGDIGVMEVDEGAFPAVVRLLKPRGMVVTNIYRDQLDRYGEVDLIKQKIADGLKGAPPGSMRVLNADDPSLAGLGREGPEGTWYYGLELVLPPDRFQNTARDIKSCPFCHRMLQYSRLFFAHLGHYRCPRCDFARPEPQVRLKGRRPAPGGGTLLDLCIQGERLQAVYPLIGLYNLYNALAAVACAAALGIPADTIREALQRATPSFGRMERFSVEGRTLLMALIKNPVGANEVLRTLMEREGKLHLLIAINDKIADGTDISWLWDADFEQLAERGDRLASVTVSGIRAWDMAVRLKYAGLDPAAIHVEENMKEALKRALKLTPPGETVFTLPTYTAMLEMRRILNNMGVGRPYWEVS